MADPNLKAVTVEMPRWLVEELDRICEVTRQSRSSLIVGAMLEVSGRLGGHRPHYEPKPPKPELVPRKLTANQLLQFEAFWKACPAKQSKGRARDSWLKAVGNGVSPDFLRERMVAYAEHLKATDKEAYAKHPATWLNQQCWDDQYDTTSKVDYDADGAKARTKDLIDSYRSYAKMVEVEKMSDSVDNMPPKETTP